MNKADTRDGEHHTAIPVPAESEIVLIQKKIALFGLLE
jgi:hypothetical protein